MSSEVDICNVGLSHIGARAQIASISPIDGSVESGYCARFYPIARKEMIEAGNFSFTKARVELSEVTNPSTIWQYAYALPADCIKALRVLELQYVSAAGPIWPLGAYVSDGDWRRIDDLFSERGSAAFEIEAGVLLTNEPEAVLLYKRDVTDTTKFTPLFVSSMGMLMASYLAGPIIKGLDGAKVGGAWRDAAYGMAAKAIAADGNAANERAEHVAAHLHARN
jgi:hypothetical protein